MKNKTKWILKHKKYHLEAFQSFWTRLNTYFSKLHCIFMNISLSNYPLNSLFSWISSQTSNYCRNSSHEDFHPNPWKWVAPCLGHTIQLLSSNVSLGYGEELKPPGCLSIEKHSYAFITFTVNIFQEASIINIYFC